MARGGRGRDPACPASVDRKGWATWMPLLALGLLSTLVIMAISPPRAAAAGNDAAASNDHERLEQFLARLGLFELRVAHLERTLDAPVDEDLKQRVARDLADLYAERLVDSSDDKARYDDTMQRIEKLLEEYPGANTTALQVMLLQADYYRAESLIASWINQPRKTEPRNEALEILTRITPRLMEHQRNLNQRVETLFAQTDELPEGDELRAAEKALQRVEGVAARATFFAAWSHYYLGLATDADSGGEPYVAARDTFFKLLGFDNALPEDLKAEWIGLDSIWRARALIGLGLSLAACGELEDCTRCFQMLEHASVPAEVRDQAPSWYMRALLDAKQWGRAQSYARQKINKYHPPATQGKVSLCVALVRAGFQRAPDQSDQRRRELGQLGLVGLARLGQLGAINTLIERYQIKGGDDSGFVLLWAAGQKKFAAAEKSKKSADHEAAAETLRTALQAPETQTLAGPAARCRYTLGWCYFRLEKLDEAAREFSNAFPGLHETEDELAVESGWMAFVAYRKLAESNPRFVTRASDARQRLERHFPDHDYGRRAGYEMTKLLEDSDPATLIEQLRAISPGDANYEMARYDLCRALHRMWKRHRDDKEAGGERLEALRKAVETYLATVQSSTDARRPLELCLLAAGAALGHVEPDLDIAETMLDQAGRFASQLPDAHSAVVEYHYRLLQLAQAENDLPRRRQEANWLADHARGSPYEQAALVIVANTLDNQMESAASGELEKLHERAYAVYHRLVDLLATEQGSLATSKNARISISRLAHYASRIGRPEEAARRLEQLLAIWPRDRGYLQRAVVAHIEAGQYEAALPHARTLVAGLAAGSEDWYEAKYHQLLALSRTDAKQARDVYRQFKLLYPDLGGPDWEGKFTELTQNW